MSSQFGWREALGNWNGVVPFDYDGIRTALLQAILQELLTLNNTMNCHRTRAIPQWLEQIARNTRKPKRRKAAKRRK